MLERSLGRYFHYHSFRPGQKEVIEDILKGEDVFAMLPTGTGKSLCYLLPGYLLSGIVVIVSPLLSLMEDQVQQIKKMGEKRVVAINSFLTKQEKDKVINDLTKYRFLYISPEMLQSRQLIEKLKLINVSLFVVDEAHCISQWGFEFRQDYLKLADIRKEIGQQPCLALTATATKTVRSDIINQLKLENPSIHIYSVDRENISLSVKKLNTTEEKLNEVVELVKKLEGPGVIYVATREWAEKISDLLTLRVQSRTAYYHGGLNNDDRLLIQSQFLNNQLDVICSTNAFGMGINKPDIRYIIHFNYPSHINAYLQEIGRAGRDGNPSCSIVLYTDHDHQLPERLIDQSFPTEKEITLATSLLQQKKNHYQFEIDLKEHGFHESVIRFLSYHLSDLLPNAPLDVEILNDTYKHLSSEIAARKLVKYQELLLMRQWLEEKGCRRQAYLRIFSQTDQKLLSSDLCCDICGLDLSHYNKTSQDDSFGHSFQWDDELRKLLHQDVK